MISMFCVLMKELPSSEFLADASDYTPSPRKLSDTSLLLGRGKGELGKVFNFHKL
ncbi:MAG: hypothetical protein KME54_11780 [Tolypothrix brevis GSE-NOS-MK-07-07A]|nr:hypothetical protein [Tolypothrix brevis GSE-NOS-MK-07-07A]